MSAELTLHHCPTCGQAPAYHGMGSMGAIQWPDPWTIGDFASAAVILGFLFFVYDRSRSRREGRG